MNQPHIHSTTPFSSPASSPLAVALLLAGRRHRLSDFHREAPRLDFVIEAVKEDLQVAAPPMTSEDDTVEVQSESQ